VLDMNNLSRLKTRDENNHAAMKPFRAFNDATFADGAMSAQRKHLIAVAVALTTQCPYRIALHTNTAREAGATAQSKTAIVTATIRGDGAITHSSHLFGR
jgi:AhpD family alkylhydroperoxidase